MAKLSAHGTELNRREFATYRVAIMSDGKILRNCGQGWKLWKTLKPGVDPVEYATRKQREYESRPPAALEYIRLISEAVPLELRAKLHMLVDLMPSDPDGVWSEMEDFSGPQVDIDDCVQLCRLWTRRDTMRATAASAEVQS